MIKAVTPAEATKYKQDKIPECVYVAFNELIKENYNGTSAHVNQTKVIDRIMLINANLTKNHIFENSFLDVEFKYREAGWNVTHSVDGCDGAYFTFRGR